MITIADYDQNWPKIFQIEAEKLESILKKQLINIEHIGSTAVPGLAAKPIIDMMLAINPFPLSDQKIKEIESIGYLYCGENGIPGRLYFKSELDNRHLHIVEFGTEFWERHLLFRNYLRRYENTAKSYEGLKKRLAKEFPTDRGAYTDGKTEFIRLVIEDAKTKL